jgi:ribosomal protein S18 acetylase RimI-like enzyme
MSIAESVTVRRATPEDDDFLLELFASTRMDEFKFIEDETQLDGLIRMQFNLQRQQYQAGYPEGEHEVILWNDELIGRMFIDEGDRELALVDISLLPAYRNSGIGTYLLGRLLNRATGAGKPVRLHVYKSNPARVLYERLGFSKVGEEGLYIEMLREPAGP